MGYVPGGGAARRRRRGRVPRPGRPARGRVVNACPGQRDSVYTPSFSADGRLMAHGKRRPRPALRAAVGPAASAGRCVRRSRINDVSLSPDGRTLALTRPPDGRRRDPRRAGRSGAARRCPGPRPCATSRASRPTGASSWAPAGRAGRSCGRRETWKPVGRRFDRARRAGRVGVDQPRRPHARHRRRRRHRPPLGPAHAAAARRPAARPAEPDRRPAVHARRRLPVRHLRRGGRAYRWDVRPSSWARHACAVAGRTLTRSEWQDVLPGRDYAPACAP